MSSPRPQTSAVDAPLQATADFYATHPATLALRAALGAGQRLWPGLAVRLAQRLFGTPLPPRGFRRARSWGAGWQRQDWPFERASLSLHGLAPGSGPADASAPWVLLVHGWGGHAGQMRALAEALVTRGIRPVLLDLPAHGASRGRTSNLPQFARAIDYVVARTMQSQPAPHAVVAHSLAANALAFAASRGLPAGRLVLLAPPASPLAYTRLFARSFGLREPLRAAMQQRIEAREGIVMSQFEPDASGPRVAQPTLVIHDRADRVNPFADGEAFAAAIPGARLLATEGLGHARLLRQPAVIAAVADFLDPAI